MAILKPKIKEEYVRSVIFNPSGKRQECDLLVQTRLISLPDMYQAWELDNAQQAADEHSGRNIQFLSLLNKHPLKIYRNRSLGPDRATKIIAAQEFDKALTEATDEAQRQSMLLWLGIFAIGTLLIIFIVALVVFTHRA